MATGLVCDCSTGVIAPQDYTPAPIPVPAHVTNFQFRAALRASGKAAAFKTYFNGLTEDAQEEWQFRPTIERDSAMVEAARLALSVTNNQLDNVFKAAALL